MSHKVGKAVRPAFIANLNSINPAFVEEDIEFNWHMGMSSAVREKSRDEMTRAIKKMHPNKEVLEVSTKSQSAIGRKLSAFNLTIIDNATGYEYPIENVFQAAKKFERGGPFKDLLTAAPIDAKKDTRIRRTSAGFPYGELVGFEHRGILFPLDPVSLFYDWLYLTALSQPHNREIAAEIVRYQIFTDIIFNPNKSLNTQARAVAIYVSLRKNNCLDYIKDPQKLKDVYGDSRENQLPLF